jgi:hypothetical protein
VNIFFPRFHTASTTYKTVKKLSTFFPHPAGLHVYQHNNAPARWKSRKILLITASIENNRFKNQSVTEKAKLSCFARRILVSYKDFSTKEKQ